VAVCALRTANQTAVAALRLLAALLLVLWLGYWYILKIDKHLI